SDLEVEPIWTAEPQRAGSPVDPLHCLYVERREPAVDTTVVLRWSAANPPPPLNVSFASRQILPDSIRPPLLIIIVGALLLVLTGQVTRPRPGLWRGSHAGLMLAAMFVLPMMVAFASDPTSQFVLGYASFCLLGLTTFGLAYKAQPSDPIAGLAIHRTRWQWLVASIGLGFFLAIGAAIVLSSLPQNDSLMGELLTPSAGLLMVAGRALLAPAVEELMFRGVIYGVIERAKGKAAAILVSAALFSVVHLAQHMGNLAPWVVVTVTGLCLSGLRGQSGSLGPSILAHVVYNATLMVGPVFILG
ncbi:MAG: CPBP family intramembrane metalloprotease, partial [Myxococcales bacterium]|nr:CPBP family intramembrane metalloprotease [Myxococcales bacterium]